MMSEDQAAENDASDLVSLTADIVSAYVGNNTLPISEIAGLVATVHASLSSLGRAKEPPAQSYTPAVSVKKSITDDAIISMIDGKPYKTLKRHLAGHGLTPEAYRQRYGLPFDYPMVAAGYAAKRSELAKSLGLGLNRRKQATAEEAESEPAEQTPKRRGRQPKTQG